MLGEGARGVTAEELDALLGASGPKRTDAVNALTGELASLDGDPAVVQEDELPETPLVHVANNVVVDDDAEILAEYLDTLAVGYGASVQSTDLGGPDGKAVLDTWVDEHTGGLIEESAIVPTADTRLVLQNAVLLAARWDAPFEVADTRPRPFDVAGESVEVDTMAVTEPFGYAEVDGWQAVRLPYTGGELHTDVILPPQGSSPADLDTDLLGRIQVGLAEVGPRPVELHLPKVDLETKADLLTLLEERTPSLVGEADLSGMSPSGHRDRGR
jgi:serpin B